MTIDNSVKTVTKTLIKAAVGKVVCVGRNYADHAKELGNDVPTSPILFIKPSTSVARHTAPIDIQRITQQGKLGELHFECELCVRLGGSIFQVSPTEAFASIDAVTLGLDLTLRDVQHRLKAKGHPWERAKAFDGACVLGEWLPAGSVADYRQAHYELELNGDTRQVGDTSLMLFDIASLLSDISQQFTLAAGDVVMTGTPKGVGALTQGDALTMTLLTTSGKVAWDVSVA